MKSICIAGRVGKDGELRRTQNDDAVLGFSVAVDDGYGQNKSTLWFDCSVWGKRAQSLEPFIKKGTPITVGGELGKREHDGKTYLTVRVNDVTLQGGEKKEPAKQQDYGEQTGKSDRRLVDKMMDSYDANQNDLDDEIPF